MPAGIFKTVPLGAASQLEVRFAPNTCITIQYFGET